MPYDLILIFLGNWKKSGKNQNLREFLVIAYSSCRNKYYVRTSKNLLKKQKLNFSLGGLFHMKNRICPKVFVNYYFWDQFLAFSLNRTSSNLICSILSFNLISKQLIYKKLLKLVFLHNYFPDRFLVLKTFQIWSRIIIEVVNNRDIKNKRKFSRHVCNILRLFND